MPKIHREVRLIDQHVSFVIYYELDLFDSRQKINGTALFVPRQKINGKALFVFSLKIEEDSARLSSPQV